MLADKLIFNYAYNFLFINSIKHYEALRETIRQNIVNDNNNDLFLVNNDLFFE